MDKYDIAFQDFLKEYIKDKLDVITVSPIDLMKIAFLVGILHHKKEQSEQYLKNV